MYQNILQQLQQMFSGGVQPGGISDMMFRQPRQPSFIDGLIGGMPSGAQLMPAQMPNPVEPPGGWQYGGPGGNGQPPMAIGGSGPAGGMPINLGGGEYSTNPMPGERPGTYGISMNPPALGRPQPWGGVEPPGSPMYGVNPGGGMPRTGGGVSAFQPINSTPGFNALPGNPGAFPGGAQTTPAPMPTPGMGGGERPGTYGRGLFTPGNPGMGSRGFTPTGPINPPGMGGSRPMPMPTPGQGFKPPQLERPMPMPGATTRPVTGFKPRVTGGY